MAFLCAFFSSVSYTLLAYFKNKVDGMTIIMHFSTFCCLACIPFMIFDFVVPDWKELLLLLLIGVFGGFGQIALTYSYRMAPVAEISIYRLLRYRIARSILGYLFLGEVLDITSVIGCGLVIVAALITYIFSGKERGEIEARQRLILLHRPLQASTRSSSLLVVSHRTGLSQAATNRHADISQAVA